MVEHQNWAIWGLEFIADEFATMVERKKNVVALCCEDREQGEVFARKHHIEHIYTKGQDMLNNPDIDIVYISTLGNEHFHNIMSCLHHKKHVFCEKAMFMCLREAEDAYQLSKSLGLFLGEANTIFYMPLYEEIKRHLSSLGTIKMLRAEFGSLKEEDRNMPVFRKEKGGGAMLDIGIYALSAVCTFLDCQTVEIVANQKKHCFGVDEQWCICLKTPQAIASIALDIRCKLPKRLVIAGDLAYFEIYNYPRADQADLVYPDGHRVSIQCGTSKDAVFYEIEKVEECIRRGSVINPALPITLRAMRLMEELRNMKEGKHYD